MHLLLLPLVLLACPAQEVLVRPVPVPLSLAPHDTPPADGPLRLHRRLLFGYYSLPGEQTVRVCGSADDAVVLEPPGA